MKNNLQKHTLVIQDISSIGRISMTVALPILASVGVNVSCLPTALLSTHPAEFEGFRFWDLSEQMRSTVEHWKKLPVQFDAIQTGYLGSPEQIQIILSALELAKQESLIIVDPAMADHGKLYSGFGETMVQSMLKLCTKASIILPNLTEATLLLGTQYQNRYDDKEYIAQIIHLLYEKVGNKSIVLTGVSSKPGYYGAASFDGKNLDYFEQKKIDDHYYGTGDIFTSVLTASLLNGKNLQQSTDMATEFTQKTIQMTKDLNLPRRFGTCFEKNIPWLIQKLDKLDANQ